MSHVLGLALILVLASNFVVLGVSRIRALIVSVAIQGVILGFVPLFVHPIFGESGIGLRGLLLMAVTIVIKGRIIPAFLTRAMEEAEIQHEDKPVISYTNSLLLGAIGTGLALEFSSTLPLLEKDVNSLIVPASLATVWTGFMILTTRHQAIVQALGYLILENGIFLFGMLLLEAMPAMVEVGVLLDLFTGVFVMVIIINHINREFSSTSTQNLSALRE
jgi:hydrogenase-4 component E